jgi:2-keto-3-deoxy-L-rhamnonate aldolase
MRTLAAHKNIVGAKLSHGDVSIHGQVALDPAINHDEFCLFTGLGQHLFSVVQLGCAGAIDALAGVFPASVVKLYDLAAADNMDRVHRETVRKLQYAISRAEELVVLWGVVGIKEALARIYDMGDRDGARLPLKGGFPNGDGEWNNWAEVMAEMLAVEEAEGTRKDIHK